MGKQSLATLLSEDRTKQMAIIQEGVNAEAEKFGIKFSWSQNTIVHNNSSISFVRLAYPGKFSCDNTLNPICDQFLSTKYIVGFRNLIK